VVPEKTKLTHNTAAKMPVANPFFNMDVICYFPVFYPLAYRARGMRRGRKRWGDRGEMILLVTGGGSFTPVKRYVIPLYRVVELSV
jgi:hypothetical protein